MRLERIILTLSKALYKVLSCSVACMFRQQSNHCKWAEDFINSSLEKLKRLQRCTPLKRNIILHLLIF